MVNFYVSEHKKRPLAESGTRTYAIRFTTTVVDHHGSNDRQESGHPGHDLHILRLYQVGYARRLEMTRVVGVEYVSEMNRAEGREARKTLRQFPVLHQAARETLGCAGDSKHAKGL